MRKITLALSAAFLLGTASQAYAQVSDVSFTVSPVVGYTIWDKNLNLGNSPFWGLRAGFGFGPLLELRASYERSFDLKGKLQGAGWRALNNLGDKLEGSSVDITRMGGELKVNLWSNAVLTPYLTAGAGVIGFEYDDPATTGARIEEDQLFGALGAGLKINLARRVALSLEVKNTLFNVDDSNHYLATNVASGKTLHNWAGLASLDFYFGGRQYDKDAVTQAYRATFGDGFRGMKFVVEPGVAYLNFHSDSHYRDTWLLGGSAGVDFNDLIGLRGFYYRETADATRLSLQLGKSLELYGAHLLTRLNVARGVTPFLTLGGGHMNVTNAYIDADGNLDTTKDGWFAMGGAGLEIPLHRTIALFGTANAMLNEQENPSFSTATDPSSIKINWLFQGGLRFNFGAKSRSGEEVYLAYTSDRVATERRARLDELNELRASYDARIEKLNSDLSLAASRLDTLQMVELIEEKGRLNDARSRVEVERLMAVSDAQDGVVDTTETATLAPIPSSPMVMTEAQLERIITRVLEAAGRRQPVSQRLSDLDKILLIGAMRSGQLQPTALQALLPTAVVADTVRTIAPQPDQTSELLKKIEALEAKINQQSASLQQGQTTQPQELRIQSNGLKISGNQTMVATAGRDSSSFYMHQIDNKGRVETVKYMVDKPFLSFSGIDVLAGVGFGDATTFNVGVRPRFQMGSSRFFLSPDVFYGFGSKSGYGLSAQVTYRFGSIESAKIVPYIGAGVGYSHINSLNRFGFTGLAGISLQKVLGGRFFVDYSLRPAFKNHQISAGYSFYF